MSSYTYIKVSGVSRLRGPGLDEAESCVTVADGQPRLTGLCTQLRMVILRQWRVYP